MSIVIRNAFIWSGEQRGCFAGDVRIEGQRIVEVSREPASLAAGDGHVIDGTGKTLMPGLVEGHGHITFNNFSSYWEMLDMPPEENLLVALENAKTYLDAGFTSIYSAGTVKLRLEAVVRDAVNAGRWPGPRIRACCPTITTTGGLNDERRLHETRSLTSMVADGADEFRRVVRLAVREGNDNIKFNMTGDDDGIPTIASGVTTMVDSEVEAGMQAAKAMGKSICAHARTNEAVHMALRHGCDVFYHCDLIDEATIDMMVAAKDRIFYAPSFGFFHEAIQLGPDSGFEQDRILKGLDDLGRVTRELHKRGVRVAIGGDYGTVLTPHATNGRDVAHLVRYAGFTPDEAIYSATVVGGQMMMPEGGLGRVAVGQLADLLLVDGNPLDDLSLLENGDRMSVIIKDGQIHKDRVGRALDIGIAA